METAQGEGWSSLGESRALLCLLRDPEQRLGALCVSTCPRFLSAQGCLALQARVGGRSLRAQPSPRGCNNARLGAVDGAHHEAERAGSPPGCPQPCAQEGLGSGPSWLHAAPRSSTVPSCPSPALLPLGVRPRPLCCLPWPWPDDLYESWGPRGSFPCWNGEDKKDPSLFSYLKLILFLPLHGIVFEIRASSGAWVVFICFAEMFSWLKQPRSEDWGWLQPLGDSGLRDSRGLRSHNKYYCISACLETAQSRGTSQGTDPVQILAATTRLLRVSAAPLVQRVPKCGP